MITYIDYWMQLFVSCAVSDQISFHTQMSRLVVIAP